MGRTKQYVTISCGDSPLLEFEHFNSEGNKEGAVVYCEESALLKYSGKTYMIDHELPEDFEVKEVFLINKFRGGDDTMFLEYSTDEYEMQIRCKVTVVPSDEEKIKLAAVLKEFGTEMAEEAGKMVASFKRMKTLMTGFDASVESVCAGFKFSRDVGIELPMADSMHFRNMGEALAYLSLETETLPAVEPFSKKRKSCD
jgi:hypothetical protein